MRIQQLLVGITLAATMSVAHATHLFVTVDPATGNPVFMIGSGIGEVGKRQGSQGSGTTLLPSQHIQLLSGGAAGGDEASAINVVDLDTFVQNADPSIIEAIIKSKAAIDQENAAFIAQQQALLNSGNPTQTPGIDKQHVLDLSALWDVSRYVYPGTAVRVQYTHIRGNSNLELYDNRRHIATVGMQIVF